jgi:division protein CdvB (Snf7/Vps24/ESCRT-III family)
VNDVLIRIGWAVYYFSFICSALITFVNDVVTKVLLTAKNQPTIKQLLDIKNIKKILTKIPNMKSCFAQSSKLKAQSSKLKAQSSKLKAQSSKLKAQSSKLISNI